MRKILQLLMLVLMVAYGAQGWARSTKCKPYNDGQEWYTSNTNTMYLYENPKGETEADKGKLLFTWTLTNGNFARSSNWTGNAGGYFWQFKNAKLTIKSHMGPMVHIVMSFSAYQTGHTSHCYGAEHLSMAYSGTGTWTPIDKKTWREAGLFGSSHWSYSNGYWTAPNEDGLQEVTFDIDSSDEGACIYWIKIWYGDDPSSISLSINNKTSGDVYFDTKSTTANFSKSKGTLYWTKNGTTPTTSSSTDASTPIEQSCLVQAFVKNTETVDAEVTSNDPIKSVNTYSEKISVHFYKYSDVTLGTGKNGALGTLCHDNYMKVPDGYVAATYTTSTNSKGKINMLTPLVTYQGGKDVVPPNTPVIVQKTSGSTNTAKFINPDYNSSNNSKSGNTSSKTNCLTGNSGYGSSNLQTNDDTSCYYYYLQKESSTVANSRVGFFWAPLNASTSLTCKREGGPVSSLGAHRVYFKCKKSVAKAKGFVFQAPWDDDDNSATGIVAITTETNEANTPDAPMYNAAGQRVGASYKGIVIQNGRKFIKR